MFSVHIDIWKAEIRKHKELFFCKLLCMTEIAEVSSTERSSTGWRCGGGVGRHKRQSACPEGLGCQEAGRTQSPLAAKWLNRTKSSQSPFVGTDRKVGEIAYVTSTGHWAQGI